MANEFVQTMIDARVDARSLSDFVFKPAGFKVARRLAPPVDTLQFYIDRFDATVATIPNIVNDAINNTAVEGGVLADTFVTVTANGSGSITRTQRDKNSDVVSVKDFGAVGDGVVDDTAAINNAIAFTSAHKIKLRVSKGNYKTTGQLTTRSNLHMIFDNDAWIQPHKWSATGSVITNVSIAPEERIQSNITIENPQMDGQYLPYDDLTGNDNAMGFARGASKVRIVGGYIKNFKFNWTNNGAGGKAINFESGVTDSCTVGTLIAENCSIAAFAQASEIGAASRIQFGNIMALDCESALTILGIDGNQDPDGDASRQFISVGNVMAFNCGHAPNRPVNGASRQKSGIVCFGEAQNAYIESITAYNDADYPTSLGYPTLESGKVGGGLTGPVGAVVWGWGRNIYINNVTYNGDCDNLIYFGRARSMGEDATPTGLIANCLNFNINQFNHTGTTNYVVFCQSGIDDNMISGKLSNIYTDVYSNITTGAIVEQNSLYIDVHRKNGTSVKGSVANVFNKSNAFAVVPKAEVVHHQTIATNGYYTNNTSILIEDDSRYFILNPPKTEGFVMVTSVASNLCFMFSYRMSTTAPQCNIIGTALTGVAATTGAITGTTGTDGNFTVSCNHQTLYFENRRGGAVTINLTFFG